MTPVLQVLQELARWAIAIGPDAVELVEHFVADLAERRPDLIIPGPPPAPPAPPGDRDAIDAEVDAAIARGEL